MNNTLVQANVKRIPSGLSTIRGEIGLLEEQVESLVTDLCSVLSGSPQLQDMPEPPVDSACSLESELKSFVFRISRVTETLRATRKFLEL